MEIKAKPRPNTASNLTCPHCGGAVSAKARTCPHCPSTSLDKLRDKSLGIFNNGPLFHDGKTIETPVCPRCRVELKKVKADGDDELETCPQCGGYWLDYQNFARATHSASLRASGDLPLQNTPSGLRPRPPCQGGQKRRAGTLGYASSTLLGTSRSE